MILLSRNRRTNSKLGDLPILMVSTTIKKTLPEKG